LKALTRRFGSNLEAFTNCLLPDCCNDDPNLPRARSLVPRVDQHHVVIDSRIVDIAGFRCVSAQNLSKDCSAKRVIARCCLWRM
jgi:hypothetical protein